ncbi:hypothetical protein NQ317_008974 [Molorchus minor]|uniref:EF-hand domain-containing protein n=1 Tax=Molorchus minor TaxID=1323400 RepID=A0ABQ9JA84_9CUCU|nr:hypothetical protein NQ317_008974 [Molorchus minor]
MSDTFFTQIPLQRHTLLNIWDVWSKIQDLLQDGKITVDEFKQAVQQCCMGRRYDDFPQAMKMFIDSNFKMVDLNDDGVIAADEYRFNCITKFPIDDVEVVDEAFNNMLNPDRLSRARSQIHTEKFVGQAGISIPRSQILGSPRNF